MSSISVPIKLVNLQDDGFHLLVEIVVFKQSVLAVLDTGASRSVFDEAFARQHIGDLEPTIETEATTLFSTSSTFLILIPRIKIGRLKLKDYHAVALNLEAVNLAYANLGLPPVVGIIGSDLLLKYGGVINYRKMKLYIKRI